LYDFNGISDSLEVTIDRTYFNERAIERVSNIEQFLIAMAECEGDGNFLLEDRILFNIIL